jgi:hypothetical protein
MKYLDFDQTGGGPPLRHSGASWGAGTPPALLSRWRFARTPQEIFRKNT